MIAPIDLLSNLPPCKGFLFFHLSNHLRKLPVESDPDQMLTVHLRGDDVGMLHQKMSDVRPFVQSKIVIYVSVINFMTRGFFLTWLLLDGNCFKYVVYNQSNICTWPICNYIVFQLTMYCNTSSIQHLQYGFNFMTQVIRHGTISQMDMDG